MLENTSKNGIIVSFGQIKRPEYNNFYLNKTAKGMTF